jgi:ADP-heptose:LPS heptosyltransferase
MSKTALVVRYGAWGDQIMVTPLYRLLKKDGYRVIANVSERGPDVLKNNPYVDDILFHKTDSVPNEKLGEHWAALEKQYDRFINLSGSIEGRLLKVQGDPLYSAPHKDRHAACNVNYIDYTLEVGGYPEVKGRNGELFEDERERKFLKKRMKKHKDAFVILWSLSGSALHKVYPWAELCARHFLQRHKDVQIITVGDVLCKLLEWEHPRTFSAADQWSMRTSMLLSKYVDLVIGTETGIMNAAACFDTPKVILLSHSSEENLTKYWKNCIALRADVQCSPCHKMHYSMKSCVLDKDIRTPVCMAKLKPRLVLEAMEHFYQNRIRRAA